MRKLIVLLTVATLTALTGMSLLWWSPGPATTAQRIVVQQGESLSVVIGQLHKAGVIPGSRRSFLALAKVFGSKDPVQAGEYEVPAGMSGENVLDLLQHGSPVQRLMTIPEGMPSIMVQERLAALPFATGPAPLPAEGSVLPDSYSFERGEARAAILKRATDAVLRLAAELGGSISAEHGIGVAKTRWLALTRSPADIATMRAIKRAFDPKGVLNPGVIFGRE